MENNSDKELRDKLRGVEAPFDPQAWEQMEAMLEKKRKPKAFIWWWTGGIAAALIIGAGLYSYNQFTKHKTEVNTLTAKAEKQSSAAAGSTTPKEAETLSGQAGQSVANNQLSNPNSITKETSSPASQLKAQATHKANSQPVNYTATSAGKKNIGEIVSPVKEGNNAAPKAAKHSGRHKTPSLKAEKQNSQLQADRSYTSAANQTSTGALAGNDGNTLNNELTASTKAQPISAADYMLLITPDALTTSEPNEETDMKKKDEDGVDLKKLKKKWLFNFSLGVAANITGTTFGDHSRSPLFYKTPSYMVGVTEDFMFLKRIAVTTGIMFSQTSFSDETFAYRCNITELNIPIGLKGYIISKQKIRFYIGTGIINHIKLKEKFTPLDVDPAPNNLANYVPSSLGISSNSFSGQYQSQIGRFSINNGKRYYASYYASAGVEFIVKKHLVFFTEPLFYMGLEKISSANKYKYNLGLSGGLRYQF